MNKLAYILLLMLLSSCNSSLYFYSTIDSYSRNTSKTNHGDFIYQSDSVDITYSFNGQNGPIQLSIYNKLDKPLIVDWQRSFIITDDVATSYFKQDASFQGHSRTYSMSGEERRGRHSRSYSEAFSDIEGSLNMPTDKSYIPPKAKIEYTGFSVDNLDFRNIDDEAYSEGTLINKLNEHVNVKELSFSEYNTPFSFRSYLTMYTENNADIPLVSDQKFFISKLFKSKTLTPRNISPRLIDRGDLFYIEEVKGTEPWVYVVSCIGVAGVAIYGLVEVLSVDTEIERPNF